MLQHVHNCRLTCWAAVYVCNDAGGEVAAWQLGMVLDTPLVVHVAQPPSMQPAYHAGDGVL